MLSNVFLKTLRDQRRALLWWGLGLLGLALYLALFYPSIRNMPELNKLLEAVPPALLKTVVGNITDFTSPVGYLNSELFFLIAPSLFLIITVGFGSNAIAGEEERGTADLLLSNPLPRWRVVVEKFAALMVYTTTLAFVFWLGLAIGAAAVDMDISLGRMAEATLNVVLLGLAFGALALAIGCASGNRGSSMGLASAVAVAAYFLNSLAPMVKALEPYRKFSPFYYYIGADPLKNGLNPGHAVVLIGLTVAFLVVALLAFERRDLAV
jgi:ABC-2 type transport system permease protein